MGFREYFRGLFCAESLALNDELTEFVLFLEAENARLRNENWYLRAQLDNGSDYDCQDYQQDTY